MYFITNLKMNNPLVSIIIPIYNAERYISKCIDSILNQTFTNFELFLINDGSSDNSGKLCNDYASEDKRITVIHKNNSGVSKTRNKGLDIANGDWIMFVDSDDWIEPQTLERAIKIGSNYQADIVGFNLFVDIEDKAIKTNPIKPDFIVREKDQSKYFIIDTMVPRYDLKKNNVNISISNIRSSCAKLFSKSICDNIRFKENLEIGEDMIFCMFAYNTANKIVFFNEYLYHYTKNTNSAMHQFKPNILEINDIIYESTKSISFNNFLKTEHDIFNLGLTYQFLYNVLNFYILHSKNNISFLDKYNQLKSIIDSEKSLLDDLSFEQNTINMLPLQQRLFLYLLKKKKVKFILLLNKVLNNLRFILKKK